MPLVLCGRHGPHWLCGRRAFHLQRRSVAGRPSVRRSWPISARSQTRLKLARRPTAEGRKGSSCRIGAKHAYMLAKLLQPRQGFPNPRLRQRSFEIDKEHVLAQALAHRSRLDLRQIDLPPRKLVQTQDQPPGLAGPRTPEHKRCLATRTRRRAQRGAIRPACPRALARQSASHCPRDPGSPRRSPRSDTARQPAVFRSRPTAHRRQPSRYGRRCSATSRTASAVELAAVTWACGRRSCRKRRHWPGTCGWETTVPICSSSIGSLAIR